MFHKGTSISLIEWRVFPILKPQIFELQSKSKMSQFKSPKVPNLT
jgi:hypothetical protein